VSPNFKNLVTNLMYYLPPVAWAVGIFVASSIPARSFPESVIFTQDKLLHMLAYFGFAFFLHRAFIHNRAYAWVRSRAAILTILVVALYGASDEFHQHFVPGRSMDFFDWVADALGGVLLILLVGYLARRKPSGTSRV
jgi:VanZ family protein